MTLRAFVIRVGVQCHAIQDLIVFSDQFIMNVLIAPPGQRKIVR